MSEFLVSVCVLLISVFISAFSHILLKRAANRFYESKLKEYLNLPVIFAYGLFLISTVLTILALKVIPLSLQPILESTSYIYISVMGYFFLKEQFNRKKIAGLALILLGIFIYSVNIAG
ncbi:MAG: EamA family transporter [Lachnospiraceae bacterium]|nr:EamA family transporter [Lachnospiraceae bacterium]